MLSDIYLYVKSFHVMAVIAWMAGLFYLPRLFVYQAERGGGPGEPRASLQIMQGKLLRVIMRPAAIASWLAGLALVLTPGIVDWSLAWPWVKLAGILGMTAFHLWCESEASRLARGQARTGRSYRMMNEVPTLLMVAIVVAVIVKF